MKTKIRNFRFHLELEHSLLLVILTRCCMILCSFQFGKGFSILCPKVIVHTNIVYTKSFFDHSNFSATKAIAFRFWNLFFLSFRVYFYFPKICWNCCFVAFGYSNNRNFELASLQQALSLEPVACSWRFPVQDMLHSTITLFVHLLLRKSRKIIKLLSFKLES